VSEIIEINIVTYTHRIAQIPDISHRGVVTIVDTDMDATQTARPNFRGEGYWINVPSKLRGRARDK